MVFYVVYLLNDNLVFPAAEQAGPEGLVAVGGDCSPQRLILAYSQGIFPWPSDNQMPLLWFSPDPRFVLEPKRAHLSKSLRKCIRQNVFDIKVDTAFSQVIRACAHVPRPTQSGTWITDELREGYESLFHLGFAHSVEAWQHGKLVGGLYGVALGKMFFGEAMFAHAPDASKVAFATLLGNLIEWDYKLIDCQTPTQHLQRFGAVPWPRSRFLQTLRELASVPTQRGPWRLTLDPMEALLKITI